MTKAARGRAGLFQFTLEGQSPSWREVTAENQAGIEAEIMEGLSGSPSSGFLIQLQTPYPGPAKLSVSWTLPYQRTIKTIPRRHDHGAI